MLQQSLPISSAHSWLDRLPVLPAPVTPLLKPCRCTPGFRLSRSPVEVRLRGPKDRSRARAGQSEPHKSETPSCAIVDETCRPSSEDPGRDPPNQVLTSSPCQSLSAASSPPSLLSVPSAPDLDPVAARGWQPSVSAPLTDTAQPTVSAERVDGSGEPRASGGPVIGSGSAPGSALLAASSDEVLSGPGPVGSGTGAATANPISFSKMTNPRTSRMATGETEPSQRSAYPDTAGYQFSMGGTDDDVGRGAVSSSSRSSGGDDGYGNLGVDLANGDLGQPSSDSPSGYLDSLVASALAFDDAAFQSTNWGDPDWDLADGPTDRSDLDTATTSNRDVVGLGYGSRIDSNASASSSGRDSTPFGSVGRGRRRRDGRGGGFANPGGEGGIDLRGFDGWDYGGYLDPVDEEKWGNRTATPAEGAVPDPDLDDNIFRASRESSDGLEPGGAKPDELRLRRRDRGAGGGRSRAGGWGSVARDTNPQQDDGRDGVGRRSKRWMEPSERAGGVDLADWDQDAGPELVGLGRSGGGKRSAIRSESALRKALAAISTRLPRIGLSVTFPLPPAAGRIGMASAAVRVAAANGSPAIAPAAAAAATAASLSSAADTAVAAATTSLAETAPGGSGARPPPTMTATMPTTGASVALPAAVAASAAASVESPQPGWATVPLSYNFGPTFRLLEERAEPVPVPLPEDLILLAGGVPEGSRDEGDEWEAQDTVLHGCTAYTIAGMYQVLLVQDVRSLEPAIAWLRMSVAEDQVLGIDAEWPPVFKSGEAQHLAMLQIASPSRVLLLHVAQMKGKVTAPGGAIHELLSDSTLVWVGCGWAGSDMSVMASAFGGTPLPAQVLDVQAAARAAGWPRVGLLGLATELLGMTEFKKPKRLSTCNWAANDVSERQVRYAAIDALLPPILLRQLRLFAGMPGLRCSFCKHAMHSPLGVQQYRPPLQPLPVQKQGTSGRPSQAPPPIDPVIICKHCSRTFWVTDRVDAQTGPNAAASPAVTGSVAAAADPVTSGRDAAGNAPIANAARPASKSKSLREFLQGVVEDRRRAELAAPPVRRPRQPLFSREPGCDSDVETSFDSESDTEPDRSKGGEGAGRSGAGEQPKSLLAAKATSKRKKKRAQQAAAGAATAAAATSSRQQALWDAFEQASPAAAAAVAMAMAGGREDGPAEAGAPEGGPQDGAEMPASAAGSGTGQ